MSRALRCLLVGVRGHGGEEVYSAQLRDRAPDGVRVSATFDFHAGCPGARCLAPLEVALNRLVHPWAAPDMGFRVLRLERGAFDLVHLHTHPTLLLGRAGLPVVFSTGSSHYHYLHDYEGWSDARIRRRYGRARAWFGALGLLDSMVGHAGVTLAYTFSEEARGKYVELGVPPDKIRVLRPGFEIAEPRPPRAGSDVTFLFLGRNPRRKGGDAVLRAFQELRAERGRARLVYVSDELPAGEPPGVELRRPVPDEELPRLYASADVFVNPTRAEGFGLTNAEAQGHGLAVISTRLRAIPEVVADGVTGLLVPPDDPAALLGAMRALTDEPQRRAEMARAGRERFLRLFTLEGFRRGLGALYDEAVERARRA